MRRADRLFDIIQMLRTAARPLTAAHLAETLEIAPRTVYRDIATLQARRVPIEGAPGVGYVLRRGFDLPPLMFTEGEIEAIAIGARMLSRTGDRGLEAAAGRVLSKVTTALPEALRFWLEQPPIYVSDNGAPRPAADPALIRSAIRDAAKLHLAYRDEAGAETERTIWPVAIAYCTAATLLVAWCELRGDFRHFRLDRIQAVARLDALVPIRGRVLMTRWLEQTILPQPRLRAPPASA